jgi:hypothetical protein
MGVLAILDHKYIHTYIYIMHVCIYIYIYIYMYMYIYIYKYRFAACTSSRELARSRGSRDRAGRFDPRKILQVRHRGCCNVHIAERSSREPREPRETRAIARARAGVRATRATRAGQNDPREVLQEW